MGKKKKSQSEKAYDKLTKSTYIKKGNYLIRKGKIGELVITMRFGRIEDTHLIQDEDKCYIVKDMTEESYAEEFLIEEAQFLSRYEISYEKEVEHGGFVWKRYRAKGAVVGGIYEGKPFYLDSGNGRRIYVREGDVLVRQVDSLGNVGEIFRLDKDELQDRYIDMED